MLPTSYSSQVTCTELLHKLQFFLTHNLFTEQRNKYHSSNLILSTSLEILLTWSFYFKSHIFIFIFKSLAVMANNPGAKQWRKNNILVFWSYQQNL